MNNINENVCRDSRRVWMNWTNRAIRDERGEVSEILTIGNDITEQKHLEGNLRTSEEKLRLYGIHKEFGILILMLVMFRIVWRIGNIVPLLPSTIPWWQKLAAHTVHWMLYGFMFALPITGWLMTSAAGLPPSFFGFFTLPSLIEPNDALLGLFENIHSWLAYGLIATFCAHVGAALKHHFINKDEVLRRMF